MIDASLAAAIAAAPAGPGADSAPADGFGDLLGQLLAATTAAMEQVTAATLTVAADAAISAGGAGTGTAAGAGSAAGADAPATGAGAETHGATTGTTEQAATLALGALAAGPPATRTGASAPGRKDADGAKGVESRGGVDATTELPEQARDAKVASAAWHAAQSARAQAPGLSAVALAAAADAPASPAAVLGGTTGDGAAKDTAIIGLDAPGASAPAATPQERRDARAEARMDAPVENVQAGAEHGVAEQALADIATPVVTAERPRAQGAQASASVSGIDGAAGQAGESAAAAAEVAQAGPSTELFASGALRRVLEAVEAAEHRPPPNTMALDIPGEGADDGLRLMVTVRGTIVEVTTQGERGLPPGWARPLAEALEQRGMTLDGFGAQDAAARGRGEAGADERGDRRPRTTPRDSAALAAARATQTLSTASDGALRL